MNKNLVAFMKGLFIPEIIGDVKENKLHAYTVQSEFAFYGYMLSADALEALGRCSIEFIKDFSDEITTHLRTTRGGDRGYKPLYGLGFNIVSEEEKEGIESAFSEFYKTNVLKGDALVDNSDISSLSISGVIRLGTESQFDEVFTSIISANQSLDPINKKIVEWFISSGRTLKVPSYIPFKENLCILLANRIDVKVTNPNDVLRMAVYMSGGDISLKKICKFKKFSNGERKYILSVLEKCANPIEMKKYDQRWIRLGEILHPLKYAKRFEKASAAFTILRGGIKGGTRVKIKSWNSSVNEAFSRSFADGVNALSERPGEFARRLDWMIRKSLEISMSEYLHVITRMKTCLISVSNKVVYELINHFSERNKKCSSRSIMIKGTRKRVSLPALPPIDESILSVVKEYLEDVLKSKFATLEPLGKVYIDEDLKYIPLPMNMRSLDATEVPTPRGMKIPFSNPDMKIARTFFYWHDRNGEFDPDLTCTFTKEDGTSDVLNFRSLSVGKSIHSGDIIARRGDCAEYIDIDIEDALELGYRYVCVDVRNYREGSLEDINGKFGIEEVEECRKTLSWTPSNIVLSRSCLSKSRCTLISVLDLKEKVYIFLDIDNESNDASLSTGSTLSTIMSYVKIPEMNVYKLLSLHAEQRGEIVDDVAKADVIFSFDDFSKDYIKTTSYMGI